MQSMSRSLKKWLRETILIRKSFKSSSPQAVPLCFMQKITDHDRSIFHSLSIQAFFILTCFVIRK